MESVSHVTRVWHPTQIDIPRLKLTSARVLCSIYQPRKDRRLSWSSVMYFEQICRDGDAISSLAGPRCRWTRAFTRQQQQQRQEDDMEQVPPCRSTRLRPTAAAHILPPPAGEIIGNDLLQPLDLLYTLLIRILAAVAQWLTYRYRQLQWMLKYPSYRYRHAISQRIAGSNDKSKTNK